MNPEPSKRAASFRQRVDDDKEIAEHSYIDPVAHRHSYGDFEISSEREHLLSQASKRHTTTMQFPRSAKNKSARSPSQSTTIDLPVIPTAPKHKGSTRTTKNNPKLVLFPSDVVDEVSGKVYPSSISDQTVSNTILIDESTFLPSDKDIMPPTRATLKRVTAYCVADAYNLELLKEYLDRKPACFSIQTKIYDEVLYTTYQQQFSVVNKRIISSFKDHGDYGTSDHILTQESNNAITTLEPSRKFPDSMDTDMSEPRASKNTLDQSPCLLFFDYGVVVTWGLTESEEKSLISEVSPFAKDRLSETDIETEALQYCHDLNSTARVFGDIIILKQENMQVKLTISHALAQSVKLSVFEELLEEAICSAQPIPKLLAATGRVSLSHNQINKKIGKLFILRMHINLVSNVLDTPEIFWSQRQWEPLYKAARSYLEISQRVDVLNQRMSVISDLLDMLKEHLTSLQGEYLEWIVIILVAIEVIIGVIEIYIMINSSVFHGPELYQ